MELSRGTASVVIDRPVSEVFAALSDITRMGEWSAETIAGRWIDGATGPALGARFEGDNEAKAGPITLKKWTTVSEVSECTVDEVFEFVTENYTTWRYEFAPYEGGTRVTQTYRHPPYEGFPRFMYETIGRRSTALPKGMQETLDRAKAILEAAGG